MSFVLRVAAPFLAVLIFWTWLENAWLAILTYHAQIIVWAIVGEDEVWFRKIKHSWGIVLPVVLTGIGAYFLIPHLVKVDLSDWLTQYGIGNRSFWLMVCYFGLLHPFIEQRHWRPLCEKWFPAHFFFAGYHVLVIVSLLHWQWVIMSFLILTGVSIFWSWLYKREGALMAPILTHVFADFGIIMAVAFIALAH